MSSLDTGSFLMRAGPSLPIPIGAGPMIGCIKLSLSNTLGLEFGFQFRMIAMTC